MTKGAVLQPAQVEAYERHLLDMEKSQSTISQYSREVRRFYRWLPAGKAVDREGTLAYKKRLQQEKMAASVNVALAALNSFFQFMNWREFQVKPLRIQRQVFRDEGQELTYAEYLRLVEAAKTRADPGLGLILQTIAGTGIRVSELAYITVEAVRRGRAEISCKKKVRTILLPGRLCKKLLAYIRRRRIATGPVFLGRSGNPLDRRTVWLQMKRLCAGAGVDPRKVYPHNLRHLFARRYWNQNRDLVKLADILGHSNINTTRIYTISSGREHACQIERLGLVI